MFRSFHLSPIALSLCAFLGLGVGAVPAWTQASDVKTDPSSPATLTLVAEPNAVPADGISGSVLTATLLDADQQPVQDVKVQFQTTGGELIYSTVVTDDQRVGPSHCQRHA